MQTGSQVQVKAYKSDGTCYRWWTATVETVEPDVIVTTTPAGHRAHDIDGGWRSQWAIRSYYWPERWYSVLEVYLANGKLVEIYVNINSPVELDVSRELPRKARLVDEDEFQEAAPKYGYSAEFQQTCYRVAKEAIEVANNWVARGMPKVDS
jgi:protein associated with RNAse G/E